MERGVICLPVFQGGGWVSGWMSGWEFRPSGDQRIPLDRSRSRTCTEPAAPALRAAFFIFLNIFFSYWNVFLFGEEVV